jgi:cytochrome P450
MKYHLYDMIVEHIVGKTSMIMSNGAMWKQARSLFNPGFAAAHLMTLIPTIVDDTLVYCRKLDKFADSGELTPMEDSLSRLLIDVMGHVVLDHDLNSQTTENELVNAFRQAVAWTPLPLTTNPFLGLFTFRQFWHWYYARKMNNYIRKVIEERIAQRSEDAAKDTKRKPAIDLAVDEYLSQGGNKGRAMDQNFQTLAIDQMKSFLFAGHDTSSTTICYVYHLLDLNPDKCEKIKKEHDEVFGSTKETADKIKANPNLLNELPYTTAVIKGKPFLCFRSMI